MHKQLVCVDCKAEFDLGAYFEGCPKCLAQGKSSALEVAYDYDAIRPDFETWEKGYGGMWKFKDLLPPTGEKVVCEKQTAERSEPIVTLGEGDTPLVKIRTLCEEMGHPKFYIKNETCNPTWSFKDRLNSCAISMAKQLGFTKVTTSTTGNHGSSAAAYAAAAGMQAAIFYHPESPDVQKNSGLAYGASIISGHKHFAKYATLMVKEHGWYPCYVMSPMPIANPYGVEGYKTIAYEIAFQLERRVPDHQFHPVAAGDGLYGTWKGYTELQRYGIIDRIPKMYAAQAADCNPVVQSLEQELDEVLVHPHPQTIALSIEDDTGNKLVLKAIRESGGGGVSVTDREILAAMRLLAKGGIIAEPASSASIAGALKLMKEGRIRKDESVLCVVTGAGVKWPEILAANVEGTMVDGNDDAAVKKLLNINL